MSQGKIVLISGPSGVGKRTIISELMKNKSLKLSFSVSMTTRQKRANEIDKKDYFFVTKEQFLEAINNNELIEYEQFCNNFYGTPKKYVFDLLNQGQNVLLEIEVKGAKQILQKFAPDEIISIFLAPPNLETLRKRLEERNTESLEVIEKRLEEAKIEMQFQSNYEFVVINNNVQEAVTKITEIILKKQN